jgi:hypothetical protein
MLFLPVNSPSSFEASLKTNSSPSRNSFTLNHFPIPKSAHNRNSRKQKHLRTLQKNMGG